MLILHFNNWFYSTKALKLFFLLRCFATLLFGLAFAFGFALNMAYLVTLYGLKFITMTLSVSLVIGFFVLVYSILKAKREVASLIFLLVFLPITLLSEYGITADFYLFLLCLVGYFEKKHRHFVVSVVAKLSKNFSPIYSQRLRNKTKYRAYSHAYRVLNLLELKDFTLIRESTILQKDTISGLTDKKLVRTFKIKGLWGSTTIRDFLYTSPQREGYSLWKKI